MAGQIDGTERGYFDILWELFFSENGNKSAIDQYAKVRHTEYEMKLWREYRLPLSEVDSAAKVEFSRTFLKGVNIREANEGQLDEAFKRLYYAVNDGCRKRCERLVGELNACLWRMSFRTVKVDDFLDFFTFSHSTRKNEYGENLREPGYGFEILDFVDKYHRASFKDELRLLKKQNRAMAMQAIVFIIDKRRALSRKL